MISWNDYLQNWDGPIFDFYSDNLRTILFSGFITLTSFLFSSYTFIIVLLKKEIYDSEWYKSGQSSRYERVVSKGDKYQHYQPLKNFSDSLIWTICICAATSISQVTFGLIPYGIAAIFCLTMAALAILRLIISLRDLFTNMKQWFSDWESVVNDEYRGKYPPEKQKNTRTA